MDNTLILDNEFLTAHYIPDGNYIHHIFHKSTSGQPYRDVLNTCQDAFLARHATGWLSDDRKFGALAPDDMEWALTVWGARMANAGWKNWAVVIPEAVLAAADLGDLIAAYFELGVVVRVFSDPDKARAWLLSVQHVAQPI